MSGNRACFRRPEFTTDLISYDVLPPYVAEQILRALHPPEPGMWLIDRIYVRHPIRFILDQVPSAQGPRRALLLQDVSYIVEARFVAPETLPSTGRLELLRALNCNPQVFFGSRLFPANVRLANEEDISSIPISFEVNDLGWMVKERKGPNNRFPVHFRAKLIGGWLDINNSEITAS